MQLPVTTKKRNNVAAISHLLLTDSHAVILVVYCLRGRDLAIDSKQGFVYVIVWLAVVFGINSASNAGGKIVIVWGEAEHYYSFPACITRTINSKYYTANHTVTN